MSDEEKSLLPELINCRGVVRAGDVLVIEATRRFTGEELAKIRLQFADIHEQFDVGIILLDAGFRVAGITP